MVEGIPEGVRKSLGSSEPHTNKIELQRLTPRPVALCDARHVGGGPNQNARPLNFSVQTL